MRLDFYVQNSGTKEIVESVYWIKDNIPEEDAEYLVNTLEHIVPIYTSHMQLNILPFDPVYEASAHFDEGVLRLQNLVNLGVLPTEVRTLLEQVRTANSSLKQYIS